MLYNTCGLASCIMAGCKMNKEVKRLPCVCVLRLRLPLVHGRHHGITLTAGLH